MHLYLTVLGAVFFESARACNYLNVAGACTWYGDGPICGDSRSDSHNGTYFNLRDHHPVLGYLMAWSQDDNVGAKFCQTERTSYLGNCCASFGAGCVTGYKRLWCQTWPGAPPPSQTSSQPSRKHENSGEHEKHNKAQVFTS